MNLYDFENVVMRPTFNDARLHAAINCASASCPRLRQEAYTPESLDSQLGAATVEFTSSPHVQVDAANRTVWLSSIFKWYAADFEDHARRVGAGDTVLDFVRHYGNLNLSASLSKMPVGHQGKPGEWAVKYLDYDWSLNTNAAAAGLAT